MRERERLLNMLTKYDLGDNASKSKPSVSNSEFIESQRDRFSSPFKKSDNNRIWRREIDINKEQKNEESPVYRLSIIGAEKNSADSNQFQQLNKSKSLYFIIS